MPTFRLSANRLREAAAAKGDTSSYAIAKRTGLAESTLSRLSRGKSQPTTGSLLILAAAYDLTIDDLVEQRSASPAHDDGAEVAPSTPPVQQHLSTSNSK